MHVSAFGENKTNTIKFAAAWAADLSKMDPTQALYAKRAINEIIFEGGMGTLRRDSVVIDNSHDTSHSQVMPSTSPISVQVIPVQGTSPDEPFHIFFSSFK